MKNKPYPLYQTLAQITDLKDMVKSRAADTPAAVAFSFSGGKDKIIEKTCHEFDTDIDAFGTFLYAKGLKGAHVAVIGENSYKWLVSFFALANGGSVAVPIDKDQSVDMAHKLMEASDCKAVIISDTYKKLVDGYTKVEVFFMSELENYIEEGKKLLAEGETGFTSYEVEPDKLAAIFFTSGTTGISKGVMLSHRNMAQDINFACKNFILGGDTLAVLPFHHTFGLITAIFMVFNYRKSVYINSSLKYLLKELEVVKPQTMFLVPLFVENFYKRIIATARKSGKEKILKTIMKNSDVLLRLHMDFRKKFFKDIQKTFGGNLEFIICGGAPLNEHYVKAFRTFGINILNGYGITECSPVLSVNRNEYWRDGSVGQILDGVSIKVSEEGEILAKGENVMGGYYKDEVSTKKSLIDGWYHTGDLGYVDEDGFLFITGREKNLIILSNGENVSPEELEMYVGVIPFVAESVVYNDDKGIVVEIFPEEEYLGNQEYFEKKIAELNKTLPVYKRLEKVKLRDTEFPKNSSKKILRDEVIGS